MSCVVTHWGCRAGFWLALLWPFLAGDLPAQEFRALWVDAFHAGCRTSSEVSQLIADARAGRFNAVVVEVRKSGESYYNSAFEPKARDISPPSFDPLADLVAKAHNTNEGARIEIHAWIVVYPSWGNRDLGAAPANHVVRQHPEWLSRNDTGTNWASGTGGYQLDPGHPGVQEHLARVAMDIVSRYDVDGLNFDYIRYPGNSWGYNETALARFNARFGRVGQPARTNPDWLQWRRDQVTALVRRVYLEAVALKPQVKISADTICFAPGVTTAAGWTNSADAYVSVLQDWRAWMEEGILDLNLPMTYFDQGGAYAPAWTNWTRFAKDHRYQRHVAIGPGNFLNSISNALFQMRSTRLPSPAGNYADGLCSYSYAALTDDGTPRSTFLAALTQTNVARLYDPNPAPLFAAAVPPRVMPWKAAPRRGHLKGFVRNGTNGLGFDGAIITLSGPTNRLLRTDANGFYGAVDLPVGTLSLSVSIPGFATQDTNLMVAAGTVTTWEPSLLPALPSLISNMTVAAGARAAIVAWTTTAPATSQVGFGLNSGQDNLTPEDQGLAIEHSVLVGGLQPNTRYYFSAISRAGADEQRAGGSFSTAGELILDNSVATYSGSWATGTASPDKFGADYRFASATGGSGTASAVFTPNIDVPGNYDVYVWYPQGSNRSTNTPVSTYFNGGVLTSRVNQQIGGGRWRQVGTNLNFRAGTNGFVRISNGAGETNAVVVADAVRFVYRADQDTAPEPAVPEWWAWHFFRSNINASMDHDGDGYSDWMEYVAGTIPTNASSRLRLAIENGGPSDLRLSFSPHHPGRLYRLQLGSADGPWQTSNSLPDGLSNGVAWFKITNQLDSLQLHRVRIDWAP